MKATVTKVTKRIDVKERKQEGILSFDIDNAYPDRVRDIVMNSTIASTCVSIYGRFIYGEGYNDETLRDAIVNSKGETANEQLYKIKNDVQFFNGFALHINYNALLEISEINYQPFSQVRICDPKSDNKDKYAVYPDWAGRVKKDEIVFIDKYTTDKQETLKQIENAGGIENWKGQILYVNLGHGLYPVAQYDSALEDMQTDSQLKTFKFRNASNNFLASHILITDKFESTDSEGRTGREKNVLADALTEYQGADEAMKILLLEKTDPEQTFDLKKVDIQSGDTLFQFTENSTRSNIRQTLLIPEVLIQNIAGRLGSADEIIDATKYYNDITSTIRQKISMVIKKLYFGFIDVKDYSIKEIQPIKKENIPSSLLTDLTKNERRALIGYPEISEGSEVSLAEKIGVGGTQSLIQIITDPNLTEEQKVASMELLFNLDNEKANKLIYGTNNINTDTTV